MRGGVDVDDKNEMTSARCRVGQFAKIIAAKNPELIGSVVLIERRRADGRWDVLLERPAIGITARSMVPVITRGFSFRDASLEPLDHTAQGISHRLRVGLHLDRMAKSAPAIAQVVH